MALLYLHVRCFDAAGRRATAMSRTCQSGPPTPIVDIGKCHLVLSLWAHNIQPWTGQFKVK